MARVKGAVNARKKHKKVLKLAKGYFGARSKQFRTANQAGWFLGIFKASKL